LLIWFTGSKGHNHAKQAVAQSHAEQRQEQRAGGAGEQQRNWIDGLSAAKQNHSGTEQRGCLVTQSSGKSRVLKALVSSTATVVAPRGVLFFVAAAKGAPA
jgi:hypothetical protein